MYQKIPESTLNLIKSNHDILDIVGEHVQLRKQGRNYFGLCPFHGENSPSFSVAPDKQIFHCFGCGAGGNVFTFMMDIEGLTFLEAAKVLADKANIPLDVDVETVAKNQQHYDPYFEAHELMKKLYHHVLLNTTHGQEALDYLLERGFTEEIIKKFQLGYAFDSWDYATNFLDKRGFKPALMEQAGVLVQSEAGDFFDRFRNRVMFPIFDQKGKTIAFSGRALGDEKPKYLNSPETAIFNKRKTLYNFQHARPHIRNSNIAILFEGFADVIAADRAGVENGVATMGTAVTSEHLQVLKRTASQVIICFDGDNAGIEAARKTADIILQAGLQVRVCTMPEGYDPDQYIKEYGGEKFRREVIDAAHSFASFKMFYHRRGRNFAIEAEKMSYIELMLQEIAKLHDRVEREFYLKQISEEFGLLLQTLTGETNKIMGQYKRKENADTERLSADIFVAEKKLKVGYQIAEENLLSFMLHDRHMAELIKEQLAGQPLNFPTHQAILEMLFAYYDEGNQEDSSLFINYLEDPQLRKIVTEIEMKALQTSPSEKEVTDCITQVHLYHLEKQRKQKEYELGEAERLLDFSLAQQIGKEIIEIKKKLGNSIRRG